MVAVKKQIAKIVKKYHNHWIESHFDRALLGMVEVVNETRADGQVAILYN